MLKPVPRKLYPIILSEINQWQLENLISNEQASALTTRYSLPDTRSKPQLITIATILGAFLTGLGALLFVASNWQHLAVPFKLVLVASAILTSHFFAWRCSFEPGNHPRLGNALLLLASMCYGAGIWLVSQAFNINMEPEQGLMYWMLGTAASAFATKSNAAGMLAAVLGGAWALTGEEARPEILLASMAVSLVLAFKNRSEWTASVALISGACWLAWHSNLDTGNFAFCGLACYGSALFSVYLYLRAGKRAMQKSFMWVGASCTLGSFLLATLGRQVPDYYNQTCNGGTVALITYSVVQAINAGFALMTSRLNRELTPVAGGTVIAGLIPLALYFVPSNLSYTVLSTLSLLGLIASLVWSGVRRLSSASLVNLGIGFFVLEILIRYFDDLFTMLDRSLFFVLGGALLMAVGAVAEKSRRKLIGGLSQ